MSTPLNFKFWDCSLAKFLSTCYILEYFNYLDYLDYLHYCIMSQKIPKLPQLDLAVHGFGYLDENYGKRHFGFSEIPPEDGICDSFLIHFGFYFGFLLRNVFVIHFGWYLGYFISVLCVNYF